MANSWCSQWHTELTGRVYAPYAGELDPMEG